MLAALESCYPIHAMTVAAHFPEEPEGGMLQELCAAAAVELAVMVGLSLFSQNLDAGGISTELLTDFVVPYFELLCSRKVPWNSRNLLTVLFQRCGNSCTVD